MQMMVLQDESGRSLPAFTAIPGCDDKINTHRLVALTGRRFVNTLFAHQHVCCQHAQAAHAGSTSASVAPATRASACAERPRRACAGAASTRARRAGASPKGPAASGAAAGRAAQSEGAAGLSASDSAVHAASGHSITVLVAVLSGQAPDHMTMAELCELVSTALYCNAVDILRALHKYVEPMLRAAPGDKVRSGKCRSLCRGGCGHSCHDKGW